jgi:zeaxanthin glucosyltransferase
MSRIGIFSPSAPGHLNPMSCLGRALQARGHAVMYFQVRDCEDAVRKAGLDYAPLGEREFPLGTLPAMYAELGKRSGMAALRYTLGWFAREADMLMDEAPDAVRRAQLDLMLVDQVTPAAASVAEHLGMPLVLVSNALVYHREPGHPPFFTTWDYSTSPFALARNSLAFAVVDRLMKPLRDTVNGRRAAWKLPPIPRSLRQSSLAHIAQQPACFDFPRTQLPPNFHYTGPFHDVRVRPPAPFPWERLTGRPLIYASMGTLQNRLSHVFQAIAQACRGLDADLVISLGGGASPEQLGKLPGDPIVVGFAPQLELLARARLTITHAGLNTALEALSYGVPCVAIPVGNDQPGVAARLRRTGAGELIPVGRLTAERLRPIVERVLRESRYLERAGDLRAQIAQAGGIEKAVGIVEGALGKSAVV